MWALDQERTGVVLVEGRPRRAVTLTGSLGAVLSLVPLVIADDPGAMRLLTFVILAAASGALLFLGRPSTQRVTLVQNPGGLGWGDESLPPPECVVLAGNLTEEPATYQAFVAWADGRQRLALERNDPAEVLRDALELARRLGLELRPGWGLERHFPATALAAAWESTSTEAPETGVAPRGTVDLPLWPLQRRTALITCVAAVFVLVATLVVSYSPDRSARPSALSIVLPTLTILATLGVGLILLGARRRVVLSVGGIESTPVLFGFPTKKTTSLGPAATRAFAIAPDRGPARHVLFATPSGAISLVADAESAAPLVTPSTRPAVVERPAAEESPARYFSTLPRS